MNWSSVYEPSMSITPKSPLRPPATQLPPPAVVTTVLHLSLNILFAFSRMLYKWYYSLVAPYVWLCINFYCCITS